MGWNSGPKKPPPSAQERAVAEIGAKQWNRYQETFLPAEDRFLDMAKARRSGVNEAQRMAEAGAAQEFGGSIAPLMQASTGSSAVRHVGDLSSAFATSVGGATASADRGQRARELQSRLRVAALGRGLASDSLAGMTALGQQATQSAIAAGQRKIDMQQALISGVTSGAGMFYGAKAADAKK